MLCYQRYTWQNPLAYSVAGAVWLSCSGFFSIAFIVLYILHSQAMPVFLANILQGIGEIGYSFYLFHFLIIRYYPIFQDRLPTHPVLQFIIILFMCLTVAALSYVCFEKSGLLIRKRVLAKTGASVR